MSEFYFEISKLFTMAYKDLVCLRFQFLPLPFSHLSTLATLVLVQFSLSAKLCPPSGLWHVLFPLLGKGLLWAPVLAQPCSHPGLSVAALPF